MRIREHGRLIDGGLRVCNEGSLSGGRDSALREGKEGIGNIEGKRRFPVLRAFKQKKYITVYDGIRGLGRLSFDIACNETSERASGPRVHHFKVVRRSRKNLC